MKNKTVALLSYNLLILVSYVIIIITLYTLFEDSIYIETHINEKVIYLAFGILTISVAIVSLALSKIIGEKIYESIMRLTLVMFMSSFSLNIVSLFQIAIKILGFNDIVYRSKFFTIHYKYSKKELLMYLSKYYEDMTGGERILPMKEKLKILSDAKTIAQVQENVEKYYNLELNSWSTKFYKILTYCTEWCFEHPYVAGAAIISISGSILFPCIRSIYNQYNIYKVTTSVSEINESVNLLSSENQTLVNACVRLESAISKLNINTLNVISVLSDYLHFTVQCLPSFNLKENQQKVFVFNISEFQKRLAGVETPAIVSEIAKNPTSNVRTAGHLLGGTATRSRLLDQENIN